MAENEKESEITPEKPKEQISPIETWGLVVVILSLFFWNISEGKGEIIINLKWFLIIVGTLLGWNFAIRWSREFLKEKTKEKRITIKPFNPEKEIPELEKKILEEYKCKIEIKSWESIPAYGRSSAEDPYAIHFDCIEQTPSGLRRPLVFDLGLLWRNIFNFKPSFRHIETSTHSRSGTRKAVEPYLTRFIQKPTYITVEPPEKEEEEEEEEENE